jgi:hypothetical protein
VLGCAESSKKLQRKEKERNNTKETTN